ncbi:hypothetical protein AVEN_144915-1, partial [Araneus ventricosus]
DRCNSDSGKGQMDRGSASLSPFPREKFLTIRRPGSDHLMHGVPALPPEKTQNKLLEACISFSGKETTGGNDKMIFNLSKAVYNEDAPTESSRSFPTETQKAAGSLPLNDMPKWKYFILEIKFWIYLIFFFFVVLLITSATYSTTLLSGPGSMTARSR